MGHRLFFCLVAFGWSGWLASAHADVSERFGGTNNTRLLASAPLVHAWRTVGSLKSSDYVGEDLWKKAGGAMLVSTNLARELSAILLDEHTYYEADGAVKTSVSWPCIVISFADARNDLDVFFSFSDNSISVKIGTEKYGLPLLVDSNVDLSRAKLLKIMKQIFPKDAYIQGLPEKL